MKYLLLTDKDNGTALVACRDSSEADRLAAAAVFSDGGVSAWIVPDLAIVATDDLYDQLRDGHDTSSLDGDRIAVKVQVLATGGEFR